MNNVTAIRENGATSGVGVLAAYVYDNFSRRQELVRGNGWRTYYEHDAAARLSALVNTIFGNPADVRFELGYNPASQITSVTRSNNLYAWTGHFNENVSSTANGLNQIGNVGAKTVTHDTKGNITAVGIDSYGYSSENFLTSGPSSTTLAYDPMGRLYQVASGATMTRMGYDGLDRVAEYNASNAVQRRYLHGPGVDEPIVWYEGSGTTTRRFLSSDERGSIIAATDSAGTVLGLNKYDEYGVPQSTNLGKFGYTGQAWVPEVGLWYYKARFMRPDIGRFMQTDPIGYKNSPNLFVYVGNSPITLIDPLGLAWATGHMPGATPSVSQQATQWVRDYKNLLPPNIDQAGAIEALRDYLYGNVSAIGTALALGGVFSSDLPGEGNGIIGAELINAGLPSLGDVLNIIFGDHISEYGRPVSISDLGTTEGGRITISGWISANDSTLMITINNLLATGYGYRGVIFQGLDAAFATASSRGLSAITISGTLANPQLASFLNQIAGRHAGSALYHSGPVTTLYLPVRCC